MVATAVSSPAGFESKQLAELPQQKEKYGYIRLC